MKKIILLTVVVLTWVGMAGAAELEVLVPYARLKEMKVRVEALEQENQQLRDQLENSSDTATETARQEIAAAEQASRQQLSELETRLERLSAANVTLLAKVNSSKKAREFSPVNDPRTARHQYRNSLKGKLVDYNFLF